MFQLHQGIMANYAACSSLLPVQLPDTARFLVVDIFGMCIQMRNVYKGLPNGIQSRTLRAQVLPKGESDALSRCLDREVGEAVRAVTAHFVPQSAAKRFSNCYVEVEQRS